MVDLGQTTRLDKISGDNQTQIAGRILPQALVVKTTFSDGTPKAGVLVQFSTTNIPVGGEGVSLSAFTGVSDSSGLVTISMTLGSAAGIYTVQATCNNCDLNPTVTFTATAATKEESIALLKFVNDFAAFKGDILKGALRVKAVNVHDSKGEEGMSVNWSVLPESSTGASIAPANNATDQFGIVRATAALGPTTGLYKFRAFCADCQAGQEIIFNITAIEGSQRRDRVSEVPLFQKKGSIPDPDNLSQPLLTLSVSPSTVAPGGVGTLNPPQDTQAMVNIQTSSSTLAWSIEVLPVFGTGGHIHDTTRRPRGTLSAPSGTGGAALTYLPSEVSGTEMIRLTLQDGSNRQVNAFVNVQMLGIQKEQLSSPPTFYRLTGNDPFVNFKNQFHPTNHYGTQTLYTEVTKLAFGHFQSSGATLGINDVSLINGGLFDLNANWQPGHECHRKGTSVDIDRSHEVTLSNGTKELKRIKDMGAHLQRIVDASQSNPDPNKRINCRRIVEQGFKNGRKICNVHFECPASEWGASCIQALPEGSECIED
ncbi:MAG: hypothetical protein HY401_09775 [Elusimicrobia bacterium]|nr:hypothetical protein [Elusimicrobiota bacterium]